MTEWEVNEEDEEEEDHELYPMEEQEEVVEEADKRELLVLRRAFSGLKGGKEEQRGTFSTQGARFNAKCAP